MNVNDYSLYRGRYKPRTGHTVCTGRIVNRAPAPYSQEWLTDIMLNETPLYLILHVKENSQNASHHTPRHQTHAAVVQSAKTASHCDCPVNYKVSLSLLHTLHNDKRPLRSWSTAPFSDAVAVCGRCVTRWRQMRALN